MKLLKCLIPFASLVLGVVYAGLMGCEASSSS